MLLHRAIELPPLVRERAHRAAAHGRGAHVLLPPRGAWPPPASCDCGTSGTGTTSQRPPPGRSTTTASSDGSAVCERCPSGWSSGVGAQRCWAWNPVPVALYLLLCGAAALGYYGSAKN